MLITLLRTIILYTCVIAALRIMGKRQIGELQPSELVIAIMISDLASIPIQDVSIPLISGIFPVFTLVIIEVLLSFATLKFAPLRRILSGRASVIIKNGSIDQEEMTRLRYSIDDLLEELRMAGYPNICDVDTAVLETNGNVSIMPKASKKPLTPEDINLNIDKNIHSYTLISDGKINDEAMTESNINEKWLLKKLNTQGIKDFKEVYYANIDGEGTLFFQLKEKE